MELNAKIAFSSDGSYEILVEEEPVIKVDRAELFKKANEAVEAGLLEKAPAKNIKTEDLIKLLEGINEKN